MDVLCPILTIAVKTADYIIDSERSAMKKLKILTIVIAFLVCLTGCQSLLSNINAYLYADTYDADKYVEQYSNSWHYKQLDASMKEFYGGMYTAVTDTVDTDALVEFKDAKGNMQSTDGVRVRFSGAKLTDGDVELLFEAFFRDNPQFFYLNREYRVEGRSIDGENLYDTIILQYLFPLVERRETIQTFNSAIASMLEGAPQGADQYDTELYLYDRLAKHCTYNEAAAKTDADDNPMAYTAYGAVVKGSAVCEGYAKAMQLLLTQSGIKATSVSGDALWSNESHMWNLVEINGNTYYLDPTWDDSENIGLHNYFNITTEMLNRTHKIDEEYIELPPCRSTADNYFVRNGTYINTYERKKIAKIIADQILDGNTQIQLLFSPKTFDNGLLFIQNGNLIFEMVNEHLSPYDKHLWDFTLLIDKEAYILTIQKAK